jgi:hypothetical protein
VATEKWGSAISEADIKNAEANTGLYGGEMPSAGVYKFIVQTIKQARSEAGNDKDIVFARLDGSWRPAHKEFDGCPMWDHLPVMASTAWRVRALCDALGVTYAEFLAQKVDKEKLVTKIGKLTPKGAEIWVNVRVDDSGDSPQLKPNGGGYVPIGSVPEDKAAEASADTGKKSKKTKKNKDKATADGAPF